MWVGTERSPHLCSRGILMGWMSLFHTVPKGTLVAPEVDPMLFLNSITTMLQECSGRKLLSVRLSPSASELASISSL